MPDKKEIESAYLALQQYNFWDGVVQKTGLHRAQIMARIRPYSGNTLIKVLVGQRRVGKSYILRQLIAELIQEKGVNPNNIFYLNKELIEFDAIQTYQDLADLISLYEDKGNISGKRYLFLDEIQEISSWEKVVNALSQNYKTAYEIFITGSNSTMLSGELSTYLSGRYVQFEISPFSYTEFLSISQLERGRASYIRYLQTGGLPELFHLQGEDISRHYVQALYDSIMIKDIIKRYRIKDVALLEHLFRFSADNIGNLFSINRIVDYLNTHRVKTNVETVSSYLGYLSDCFLLHEAQRYDIKGKSWFASTKKYYLNDLAFKTYFASSYDTGLGKHLENALYLHFKGLGYRISVGVLGDKEIDFVIENGQDKKYVQVAFSVSDENVMAREFSGLATIQDAYEKWVISLDEYSLGAPNGIKHIRAWELG